MEMLITERITRLQLSKAHIGSPKSMHFLLNEKRDIYPRAVNSMEVKVFFVMSDRSHLCLMVLKSRTHFFDSLYCKPEMLVQFWNVLSTIDLNSKHRMKPILNLKVMHWKSLAILLPDNEKVIQGFAASSSTDVLDDVDRVVYKYCWHSNSS